MQIVKFTLLALLFSCLLTACGHKGPLYLPKDEPIASSETSQQGEGEEQEGEKKEEKEEAGSPS